MKVKFKPQKNNYGNTSRISNRDSARNSHYRVKGNSFGEKEEAILNYIIENPGKHYREIWRQLGLSKGTLSRRLEQLEEACLIKHEKEGSFKFFFPVQSEIDSPLLTPMQKWIIGIITKKPGSTYRDLARKTGRTPKDIYYHMKNLRRLGRVTSEKEKETLHWFLDGK